MVLHGLIYNFKILNLLKYKYQKIINRKNEENTFDFNGGIKPYS